MRGRKGFTLVELLVVVGIIAVLISILLPVLNKARQQASRVKCQSNMKQLMYAVLMYANDGKNFLPYCNWDDDVNVNVRYSFGWLFTSPPRRTGYLETALNGNWKATMPPERGMLTGVLYPYLKNVQVYRCPIDVDRRQGTHWMTSYLMDGSQCGFGLVGYNIPTPTHRAIPGARISQIRRPQDDVLFWEALEEPYEGQNHTTAIWNDGSSFPTEENLSDRHYKGANVACLDGHVEWWDQSTYWNEATPVGQAARYPTRLWWNPWSANGH